MIRRIEAKGYKCLKYVRQPLGPFQILVGPNASGKTTFLDVVAFLGDLLRVGPQKAVEKRARSFYELVWMKEGDEFELAVELAVPEEIVAEQPYADPYRFCRYEVRVGIDHRSGGVRLLGENFWLLRGISEAPVSEQISVRSVVRESRKKTPTGWRKVVSLTDEGRAYVQSELTNWRYSAWPEADQPALTMALMERARFPISRWARQYLTTGTQVLMLNSLLMRQPCPPYAPLTFQPDGSNLPIVVRELRKKDPERFDWWRRHIQGILPYVQDIRVVEREEDRYLYLIVDTREGVSLPSWLLSDGMLRLMALTVLAYLPDGRFTYLIEEPENGVHPRAIEGIFQSLSSVYDGQVLIATHSILLVGLAKPENLLCFTRTKDGATHIVLGSEHPVLRQWRGEVDLGSFYASGVLE